MYATVALQTDKADQLMHLLGYEDVTEVVLVRSTFVKDFSVISCYHTRCLN